jgi:ArsR family transcriptional regulator, arsenate/arsenite/antimonite-responsive transcriptional repressor
MTVRAIPVVEVTDGCCGPSPVDVLDLDAAERLAASLKAVADPARLRLLSLVARSTAGEACICDLTDPVGLSQPTVSHHMRVLADAGLLTREQRGRWAYYRLVPGALPRLAAAMLEPLGQPSDEPLGQR